MALKLRKELDSAIHEYNEDKQQHGDKLKGPVPVLKDQDWDNLKLLEVLFEVTLICIFFPHGSPAAGVIDDVHAVRNILYYCGCNSIDSEVAPGLVDHANQ